MPPPPRSLRRAVRLVEDTLRAQGYAEVGHIVEFFGKSPSASRTQAEVTVPAGPGELRPPPQA